MVLIGSIIVALTLIAIAKRYETRMVLCVSGFAMAIVAGNPLGAMDAFAKAMVNAGLVTVICTVMGFSFVMKFTGCDEHLVQLLASGLKKVKFILIPGAILITWLLNIALSSTAGTCAAVGAVLIPTLIKSGVHPAMAGASVMVATFASVLNPGFPHALFVAELAKLDGMAVIGSYTLPVLAFLLAVLVIMVLQAKLRKEGAGTTIVEEGKGIEQTIFKVSLIKAAVPIIPLIILVLATPQVGVLTKVTIPQAMIMGAILGFAVHRRSPGELTKQFFNGLGNAYGNIIGIIIAAGVFTYGMQSIGLTGALIEVMKNSQDVAKYAACLGPSLLAVLCGSGDAAALAFNGAVTPHAALFGMTIPDLGSLATLSSTLGRTMSPVAGGTIICATLAGVSPIEIAKRTAPAMIFGLLFFLFVFGM